jgi:uncharacterized protein VirK/YbjX
MLAPALKAERIMAVSNDHRYIQHPFFRGGSAPNCVDYDEAWEDRGGTRIDACQFELPMALSSRPVEDVPSRKRGLYRRRNEMLAALQTGRPALADASILRFEAT